MYFLYLKYNKCEKGGNLPPMSKSPPEKSIYESVTNYELRSTNNCEKE